MFKITVQWLKQFATPCGPIGHSWNSKQLKIIGLSYPLHKGWIFEVIDQEITEKDRELFESLMGQSKKKIKIQRGQANMLKNPIYHTTPDGKGSWTGHWMSEARWPWCK